MRGVHMLFIEYPKCTTCQKAKKWLSDNGITFEDRNIKEENPTYEELKVWYKKSGFARQCANNCGRGI